MQKHLFNHVNIESIDTANIRCDRSGNLYNTDYNDIYYQRNHGVPESFYVYIKQSNFLSDLTRQLIRFDIKSKALESHDFNNQTYADFDPYHILDISHQKLLKRIKYTGKNLIPSPLEKTRHTSNEVRIQIKQMTDEERLELHILSANLRNNLLDNFVLTNKFSNSKVPSDQVFKIFELGFGSGLNCLLTLTSSYLYRQVKQTFSNIAPKKIRDQILDSFERIVPNQNVKDLTKLYDEFINQDFNQSWIKNMANPFTKDSAIFEFWTKDKDVAIDLLQLIFPYYKQIISKFSLKDPFSSIINIADTDYIMQYVSTEKTPIDAAQIRAIFRANLIPEIVNFIPEIITHAYESLLDFDFLINFEKILSNPTFLYEQVSFKATKNYLDLQEEQDQQVALKDILSKPINKLSSLFRLESLHDIFDFKNFDSDAKHQRSRYKNQMENIVTIGIHVIHKLMMMCLSKCYLKDQNELLASQNDSVEKQVTDYITTFSKQLNSFGNQNYNVCSFAQVEHDIVQVFYGDVKNTLQNNLYNFANQFNCLYLDGFDHKKNKEVWSHTIACALAHISRPFANISTFAAFRFIKESFFNAGFHLDQYKNAGFRKREMMRCKFVYPGAYLKSLGALLDDKNDRVRIADSINDFYKLNYSDYKPYSEKDLICKRTSTAANDKSNPTSVLIEQNHDLIKSLSDYICEFSLPQRLFGRHNEKLKHMVQDLGKIKFNIWGAGIAGISVANYLESLNFNFTLIEKESQFKASNNALGLIYPQLFDDDETVTYLHNHAFAYISQKLNYDFEMKYLKDYNASEESLDVKFLRWQYEFYRPIHVILNGYENNDYQFRIPKLPELLFQYESKLNTNTAFESFKNSVIENDVYSINNNGVIVKAIKYRNLNNYINLDDDQILPHIPVSHISKPKSYYLAQKEKELSHKVKVGDSSIENKVNELFVKNHGAFVIRGYKCFVNELIRDNLYRLNKEHKYSFYPSELGLTRKFVEKENKLLSDIESQVFSDVEYNFNNLDPDNPYNNNYSDTHSFDRYKYDSNEPQIVNKRYYNFVDYTDGFAVGRDYQNLSEQVLAIYNEHRENKEQRIINIVATGSNLIHSPIFKENGMYATSGKISIICANDFIKFIKETVNDVLNPKLTSSRLNRDSRESTGTESELNNLVDARLYSLFRTDTGFCSDCYHSVCYLSDLLFFNTQLNPSICTSRLYGISGDLNELLVVFGATHHRNEEAIKNLSADNYYNTRKFIEKIFNPNDNIISRSETEEIIELATNRIVQYMQQTNTFDLGCGARVNLRDRMPFVGYFSDQDYSDSLYEFVYKTYNPTNLPGFSSCHISSDLASLVLDEKELADFHKLDTYKKAKEPIIKTLNNFELDKYARHQYHLKNYSYNQPMCTYVLTGLGSRGLTLSRLLTIHSVHEILGLVSPLADGLVQRMHPQRQQFKKIISGKK